jgi:transposase
LTALGDTPPFRDWLEAAMVDDVRLDGRLGVRDEASAYRRVEVITGRRLRRRWSDEEKARIVAESADPDANISEVARRHGVNRGLLTAWRRQAQVQAETPTGSGAPIFVPVAVERGAAPIVYGGGVIEVELPGARVKLNGSVAPALASAVIAAVRSRV